MEQYFTTMFENKHHELSLILLLSVREPEISIQNKLTDHELKILKKLALEKIHRQLILKEHVVIDLLEKQFSK